MSDKKFYWLKLKKDFFKRHDIHILSGMENGNEIVLFYIKLMLESIDHEGTLRFSDSKPYTNGMLARITDTSPDIVEQAMDILVDFGLVEVAEDKTIILPKVTGMVGFETDWARKKREYRETLGQTEDTERTSEGQSEDNVRTMSSTERTMSDKSKSKSKSKRIELDIKRNVKEKEFNPPTLEDVIAYCQERNNSVDAKRFFDYYNANDWKDSKGNQVRNWKQKLITWENKDARVAVNPQPISKKEYGLDYNAILAQARENDRKAAEGK